MVELGVRQHHAFDWHVTHGGICDRTWWHATELLAHIGRGIQEKPSAAIAADGDRRLRARYRRARIVACETATWAPAVPLREAAACGATEQKNVHARVKQTRARRDSREPRRRSTYFLPAYAVTSNVTATTVNSGLVQAMRQTPSLFASVH